ncbi:MAG TPA: hypothetical protein EYP10_06360, partial [Armatimonadetes bacterium]|nr:hypothetical protein [Armatimonadota bacterium]
GSQTLWRIGIADNSYDEFAIAGNYRLYTSRFSRDVTFIVGKSTPKRDWSFIQPGPIDYWARHRRHPFRIRFNLSRVPGEYCRLVIDFVNTHRSHPPLFEVKINDRAQYQFALPTGGDDRALTNPKFGREYILHVTFPARHLRRGENVITLTIIAGSWVLYDALWLEGDVAVPKDVLITNVQAKSTMLFKRINGQLKQLIEIVVTNTGAEGDAIVRITGARRAEQKVHLIIGSTTAQVFIKPIERPMKLRITVQTAKTQRSTVIEAKPVRRWLVFVTPSTHTDIGYTDLQTRTFKRHNDNTKAAIEACSRESVFKWNLEVAFQARNYRREGEHEFRKLVEHLRTGRIGLQGLYLNMLTGLCSGEELARA